MSINVELTLPPIKVADIMTSKVFSARITDSLDTALDVMLTESVRHLPVVDDDGGLVGILSHRDLLAEGEMHTAEDPEGNLTELGRSLANKRVNEVMHVAESVQPDTPVADAASILLENRFSSLPVVENQQVVGIVTETDFVRLVHAGYAG